MILQESMGLEQKLAILADAAKYDVACTSSGVARDGQNSTIGNTAASGICHTFSADGRCISLLKILFTNECIFDCKYCINRCSNDIPRATFTPEEVCSLTIEFYRRNYIEGLFLSSGILHSPNETMELIIKALRILRQDYDFGGYIHCKAIPGASPELIEIAGWYADRMSVNLELPTNEALKSLAPHKSRMNILNPMRQIQSGIEESRAVLGMTGGNKGAHWYTQQRLNGYGKQLEHINESISEIPEKRKFTAFHSKNSEQMLIGRKETFQIEDTGIAQSGFLEPIKKDGLKHISDLSGKRGFVSAGQSTQMIIGATPESDYQIISVAEALYQRFDLKRVFYSAFIRVNEDSALPVLQEGPPLLREHRLYQADWLLRYYGFQATELLSAKTPNFNQLMDPKCNWALLHLEQFPIEVNKADYFTLLRVPGIGMKSARRIVDARKTGVLKFDDLKKIGVVLKRALYFITCSGRMMYSTKMEQNYITKQLIGTDDLPSYLTSDGMIYQQLNLFEDIDRKDKKIIRPSIKLLSGRKCEKPQLSTLSI